jgi:hypothetical protein
MAWEPTVTSSAAYDRLYTTVASKVSGVSENSLVQEIANTFQAFARETGVWQELVERNLIADQSSYELSPSMNDAEVHFIINVEVENRPYRPYGYKGIPRESHQSVYEVKDDYTTIVIHPTPGKNVPKGLKAWVSLAPCIGSVYLPSDIIDRYFESIQDGVLERLYGHTNRPYTDPAKEERHRRKFHAAVTRVRRSVRGGKTASNAPWSFPTQAPGRPLRGSRSYGW